MSLLALNDDGWTQMKDEYGLLRNKRILMTLQLKQYIISNT